VEAEGFALSLDVPGYRLIRQIGTGAGSKISLAVELNTRQEFAIKHVLRDVPDGDKFIEQVETEYLVSHQLQHRNLRHSFSIHRLRKRLLVREVAVVMEYVDGLSLEKARPNRLNTFLTLFTKVAAGLDAMHNAGFVHSDIKPTNIMIARGGVVKIIDFGQSCRLHHRKARIQGTPDYIAPEQVRRLPLDQRTDVFNLGATMYWVLTSEKYPTELRGPDQRGGINVLTANKPIAPVELNNKIPLALSQLVMDCCKSNPKDRPSDMRQVMARLSVVRKLWTKYLEGLRGPKPEAREEMERPSAALAVEAADSMAESGAPGDEGESPAMDEDPLARDKPA